MCAFKISDILHAAPFRWNFCNKTVLKNQQMISKVLIGEICPEISIFFLLRKKKKLVQLCTEISNEFFGADFFWILSWILTGSVKLQRSQQTAHNPAGVHGRTHTNFYRFWQPNSYSFMWHGHLIVPLMLPDLILALWL